MTFDGVRHPLGNDTRVCFDRLVDAQPVLLVVQEANRDWRSWIVALNPNATTIFDSAAWDVGRDLVAEDLDGDGRFELVQESLHYWFFDGLNNVNSPFPEVVFAFDPDSGTYRPATSKFPQRAAQVIERLEQRVARMDPAAGDPARSDDVFGAVAEVVVALCYEGREDEAWSYFDRAYTANDAPDRRRNLRRHVADDPIFRAVAAELPGERSQ